MNGIIISSEEYTKAIDEEIKQIEINTMLPDKEKKYTVIAYERQKKHLQQKKIISVKAIIDNKTYYAVKFSDKIDNTERQQILKEMEYIKKVEEQIRNPCIRG